MQPLIGDYIRRPDTGSAIPSRIPGPAKPTGYGPVSDTRCRGIRKAEWPYPELPMGI